MQQSGLTCRSLREAMAQPTDTRPGTAGFKSLSEALQQAQGAAHSSTQQADLQVAVNS